jgi:hypothetical protein
MFFYYEYFNLGDIVHIKEKLRELNSDVSYNDSIILVLG